MGSAREVKMRQEPWRGWATVQQQARWESAPSLSWDSLPINYTAGNKISMRPLQIISMNHPYPEDYSPILRTHNNTLFIGNLEAAQNLNTLQKLKVKAILTAARGVSVSHPRQQIPYHLKILADDSESFDISKYFHQAANFIRDALQKTSLMVHCLAGVSRSVSLVIAYLIKHQAMDYSEAYALVKGKRRVAHPNDGFVKQLQLFERQVKQDRLRNKEKQIILTQLPVEKRIVESRPLSQISHRLNQQKNQYKPIPESKPNNQCFQRVPGKIRKLSIANHKQNQPLGQHWQAPSPSLTSR